MQEFVVYILYSRKSKVFYKGFTSNLIERFKSHNMLARKGYTTRHRPWTVVHVEFFTNESEARRREAFLKTGAGRNWIRQTFNGLQDSYPP